MGFETAEQAKNAKDYFHSTYIDTAKIQVEDCRAVGDADKPRAWSQHSADSSRFQARQKPTATLKTSAAATKKELEKSRESEDKFTQLLRNPLLTDEDKAALEKARNDPEFVEFYQIKTNKSTWNNDDLNTLTRPAASAAPATRAVPDAAVEKEPAKESFDKMKNAVKIKRLPKGVTKEDLRNFFKPLNITRVNLPKKARSEIFYSYSLT